MSSTPGVVIREATPSDARAIAEVHIASWRWAYRDDLPAELLDDLSVGDRETQWSATLASERAGAGVIVAEEAGRVVGFCSVGPSRDDDATERTGEVLSIYLVEEAAGRGIGRDLFASAVERIRAGGYERATLWVMASNARSRRFYELAGWAWDGTTSEHQMDCGNVPIVRYAAEM